jgi:hypothetical protein
VDVVRNNNQLRSLFVIFFYFSFRGIVFADWIFLVSNHFLAALNPSRQKEKSLFAI